ncbi:At2g23090 like protein [Melampsora americana]|nr:At2g23090 like protein [Melampsora americana]KAH9824415.1 At2g23090 like protein [Melampsora americana]
MGGGNGAKAAQKRERNAKAAGTTAKSQLKVNEAAKNIQCKVCFQTFLQTSREPALKEHAENKHSRTLADCFPMYKP